MKQTMMRLEGDSFFPFRLNLQQGGSRQAAHMQRSVSCMYGNVADTCRQPFGWVFI
jgi:hypothetical protein